MLVLDDKLMKHIATSGDATEWLILDEHPDFPGGWIVNCLEPGFLIDFIDLIGPYRYVSPSTIQDFLNVSSAKNYKVAFGATPEKLLSRFEHLNDEPSIAIKSDLPGTSKGFLPYQLQGFNFLKDQHAGVAMWSTGTGKTVLASALLKYHIELGDFDYAFFVVRAHNKVNTQRSLRRLADIDSVVLDGPQKRRKEMIGSLVEDPLVPKVVVTNYEKFRIDLDHLIPVFEHRVLLIWDEMPTKLKNRKTVLYKAVRKLLYRKVNLTEPRPESLRQYMLSATPIENDPEDWFNCVRLLDPNLYGSIQDFYGEYVSAYSFHQPTAWRDLDKMGLRAAAITHQVDKSSPDIAKQFPKVIKTPLVIDWNDDDRAVYDQFLEEVDIANPLPEILVAQMLCDAPTMVLNSTSKTAEKLKEVAWDRLRDDNHAKLETLRQLVTEDHQHEKVIIFTAFADALLPILEDKLIDWGVSFVKYDGTVAEKQSAQDYFQNEKWVQVFLSSDKGSDSISLEQASVVIHYDLPWKWSTYVQRQNRAHRITSAHNSVRFYTLMMADSVEDRKLEVLQRKEGYHEAVFKGIVSDQAEAARLTQEDLRYILGAKA